MRLLLAEDEKALSKAIVTLLEKSHYSVDAVYNGQEALDYLAAGNYDGMILDIMMPKLDGISVLQALRAQGSRMPVLILSAKSEVDDKVLGLDTGANDYLTKPFAGKELLARIRAMTRAEAGQTDATLTCGNTTLDCAAYRVFSAYGSFTLSNKEFQVLELLMRHPGQIISAEQMFERIWGFDSEAELNVVWTYVSYLRKKLAALRADAQIKAKRNAGYMLVTDDVQ